MDNNGKMKDLKIQDTLEVLVFNLSNEKYCVDLKMIREIAKIKKLTKVPNTPTFIKGLIDLRGKIVTIIDMKELLKIATKNDLCNLSIICEVNDDLVGFCVDNIERSIKVSSDEIRTNLKEINPEILHYVKGHILQNGEIITSVDLEKIIFSPEITNLLKGE